LSGDVVSQHALKRVKAELLTSPSESGEFPMERCRNPWNKECKNDDIEVYIVFKGDKLPICRRCWSKIAEKDLEW
jgi:hypothetical protein